VALLLSLLFATRLYCPDAWWHLATGRWIVEHGRIPGVDPFSFTARGAPWRGINWLADLALYGAWAMGGFGAVVALKVGAVFTMLLGMGLALRELEIHRSLSVALLALLAVLVQPRYAMVRPQVFGAAFLALSIFVCLRWWPRQDRSLAWLAVIALVWIPVHGTAVLAPALAGVALAASLIRRRPRRRWLLAGAVLLVMGLLFLVTPSGRDILYHLQGLDQSRLAIRVTAEWSPVTLDSPLIWIPGALTAFALVSGLTRWRESLLPLGMAAVGVAIASRYDRNVYPALLLVLPLWALAGQRVYRFTAVRGLRLVQWILPVAIAGLLPALHLLVMPAPALNLDFGFGVDESRYPRQTLRTLRGLPAGRTLHNFALGGYLIWKRLPGGVFHDGRNATVYTEAHIRDNLVPTLVSEQGLEAVAQRFGVTYGLAWYDHQLGQNMMRSRRWIPIRHGRHTTLFVRRARAALVKDRVPLLDELRFVRDRAWMRRFYGAVLAHPARRKRLARAIAVARDRCPENALVRRVIAYLRLAFPGAAIDQLLDPSSSE
jgi:hypothetical protein